MMEERERYEAYGTFEKKKLHRKYEVACQSGQSIANSSKDELKL